ncbi:SGNH/GDSL hydrolase family protein, partial [Staphylococcus aureus]
SGEETFEHAGLVMEARSALAEIYGDIHAEPFKDGKVTDQETMDKELQSRLKKSLKQSLSLDFLVLREAYPEADPQPGDIVQIKSTVLGLNDLVRIVEIKTIRDINNVIVKQDVTLGEFNREQRYMKKVNTAANYVSGLNDVNLSNPSKAAENLKSKVASIAKSTLDLMSKTDLIEDKQKKVSSKTVTTSDGTIVHDFVDKSNIKDIKTIGTIGDSVARGSHAKTNFTEMLGKKLKAKTTNLARGGATMATVPIGTDKTENSIYRQAEQIRGDLIIVQGTDDDWLHGYWQGVPIGDSKIDLKTFYGAFCSAINVIKENNPQAKILVMTATRQCPMDGTKIRRKDTDKNKLGLTLEDYVNAQVLACSELDVPVYDAYHTDYFKPYNPAFRKSSMPDGLHPNERGHEVIMYELIKNYYQFYG